MAAQNQTNRRLYFVPKTNQILVESSFQCFAVSRYELFLAMDAEFGSAAGEDATGARGQAEARHMIPATIQLSLRGYGIDSHRSQQP